jgi:hypothetical protein
MSEREPAAATLSVGADRVVRNGGEITIQARVPMAGWEARRFRRAAIVFRGRRYRIVSRTLRPDGSADYVLEPWPSGLADEPAAEIVYDDAYVAARDAALARQERAAAANVLFLPFTPFVGFLWSGAKRRVHERFGIHPRSATEMSVWLEFGLLALAAALLSIHVMAGAFGPSPLPGGVLLAVAALVGPDAVVRYGSALDESMEPPGLYEWLFRMRLR